ncbi:hypothetical protein COY05_00640 [Candidatus Peregrinibacteria bacterium CG_4_10_14_0_2_um_filter_38_24]|nr:MAG: hypothetical protein COY05_00640 [Candidatus Peregrinibacteria bacterium CG_4_10_14_0_2_um_filter_38_24]PJC38855.1 MAG: hypothetical protein CO044_02805 [Candidatus Peregrinibacteria bacterium CG_4_9_14_0_2_um_filter_38_9]
MNDEQYQTPNEEKSKTRRRVAFFLIILGSAILYFVWANFLDFGKVTLYGEAPFKAELFGVETFFCVDSPCELKAKTGNYQVIISKENFQQDLIPMDFKLWKTTPYTLAFKVNPYIEETDVIPEKEKEILYDIMFNEETKNYKLFDKSDSLKKALTYFTEEIKDSKIFGSKYSAIVIENPKTATESQLKAYTVNLAIKAKTPLPAFDYAGITEWKFSPDGNLFQFKTADSDYWWLMDLSAKNISAPTQTKIENTLKTDWIYGNEIMVMSQNFTLNLYNPRQGAFKNLGTFTEIKEYPQDIIAGSNGGVVYVETKDKKFRIILQ